MTLTDLRQELKLLIYLGTMPFTISTTIDCAEEPEAQECVEVVALALPGG